MAGIIWIKKTRHKPKYVCNVRNTNPDLPCAKIFMEKGEAEQENEPELEESEDDLKQCSVLEQYDGNILAKLIEKVYIYMGTATCRWCLRMMIISGGVRKR